MKHTFWYIDHLMEVLSERVLDFTDGKAWGPGEDRSRGTLRSDSEKRKARKLLDKIKEYDKKLRKLIDNHRNEEHLRTLHNCHVDSIPNWADRVKAMFKKFDALLKVLEEDIPKLEAAIESEHHMWGDRHQDMVMGFLMAGVHDAEQDMEEFRKASIFERKHLQEILGDLKDLEEVLE